MEQALSTRVVGQDEAIKSVSQCVRLARAGVYTHTLTACTIQKTCADAAKGRLLPCALGRRACP
jgi:hypothetical protein